MGRNLARWRVACLRVRGRACRACGDRHDVQMDHLIPRSQGGREDVENGLPLCGPWSKRSGFPNGCHAAKTEKRLKISLDWLDDDQIAYLAEKGWVYVDGSGELGGRGCRGFVAGPVDRSG